MYMYNFHKLINIYKSNSLYLISKGEGYYDSMNNWIDGEEEYIPMFGVVTNLATDDLQYDEGGTYNQDDRKLYCYEELGKGTQIQHQNKVYTILHDMDYTEHDKGLHIYYMKRGDRD